MNNKYLWFGLCALTSCSQHELAEPIPSTPDEIKVVTMSGEDYSFERASRSSFVIDGNKAKFKWNKGDVVGVFPIAAEQSGTDIPNEGTQVPFPIRNADQGNKATFNGGGWSLKPNYTYSAYYPLRENWYTDKMRIPVNYLNQTFTGFTTNEKGEKIVDFSKYDFMAAQATKANTEGYLNFRFQHIGALVILNFEMEKPGKLFQIGFYNMTDKDFKFILRGNIDITQTQKDDSGNPLPPVIVPEILSTEIPVSVQNVTTTADNRKVQIYFQMAPARLKDQYLGFVYNYEPEDQPRTIKSAYSTVFITKDFVAGKGYSIHAQPTQNNTFRVDTPGKLRAMIEARQGYVTDMKVIGRINGDDLQCIREFAGGNSLSGTTIEGFLTRVDLSEANIVAGGNPATRNNIVSEGMFAGCTRLRSLILPKSTTGIETNVFNGSPLNVLNLPIKATVLTSFPNEVFTGFTNAAQCDLTLDPTWEKEVSAFKFKGQTWKSIRQTDGSYFPDYQGDEDLEGQIPDIPMFPVN